MPLIKRTLAIRILQKSKAFYTTIKFDSLAKQLAFYGDWKQIERLIFECNREGLIITVVDHANRIISFDKEVQLTENLMSFGTKLRVAFNKITELRTHGQERNRIFMKVIEKMDEEKRKAEEIKRKMNQTKLDHEREAIAEKEAAQAAKLREEADKKLKFQEDKRIADKLRIKNEILSQLQVERQKKCRDVLQDFKLRGIKRVAKEKVEDLLKQEELDYDVIMNEYQIVLRKEREYYDVLKVKKLTDVEIWTRATKEEESIAMREYAEKHGKDEMRDIVKRQEEKHARELETKQGLASAEPAYKTYMAKLMDQRRAQFAEAQRQFAIKQGQALMEEILVDARKQKKVAIIKEDNAKAAEIRKQRDIAKAQAAGNDVAPADRPVDETEGWGRGTLVVKAKEERAKQDDMMLKRSTAKPADKPDQNFQRGVNVNRSDAAGKDSAPIARAPRQDDGGFLSRSDMGAQRTAAEESKKDAPVKRDGPPVF